VNESSHYAGKDLRGMIFLEEAEILEQTAYAGGQFVLRLRAPKAAEHARPGSFAHIGCDPSVRLRRPLSIMRADPRGGWIELLYKIVGDGLGKLSGRRPGERISVLAPIGNGFTLDPARPRVIGLGGGVGIPPIVFAADRLRADPAFAPPLMLMGSELPFPFEIVSAGSALPDLHPLATHSIALLEDWSVPSRLASNAGLPGAFPGHVTSLARVALEALSSAELAETQLIACGPELMLRAAATLAAEFGLPCEMAVEEYMACGVGGCAGCTVLVHTSAGPAMKRVCVDGPVFEAREIYP
jgi:dihydroorotate dehydrogenase electron transfer subunit